MSNPFRYEVDPNLELRPFEPEFTPIVYTLWWRPPEVLLQELVPHVNECHLLVRKADVWAVGICFFNLIAGPDETCQRFLRGKNSELQLWKIFRAFDGIGEETSNRWRDRVLVYTELADDSVEFSKHWLELLSCPPSRPRFRMETRLGKDLSESEWDLMKRFLQLDVRKRISIDEALRHSFFTGSTNEDIRAEKPKDIRRSTILLRNQRPQELSHNDWIIICSWLYDTCSEFQFSWDCFFVTVRLLQIVLLTIAKDMKEWKRHATCCLSLTARYMGKYVPSKDVSRFLNNEMKPKDVADLQKTILKHHAPVLCSKTAWASWIEKGGHHSLGEIAKNAASIFYMIELSTVPFTQGEKVKCANVILGQPLEWDDKPKNLLLFWGHVQSLVVFVLNLRELNDSCLKLFQNFNAIAKAFRETSQSRL